MKCVECGREAVKKIVTQEFMEYKGEKILANNVSYYYCSSCEVIWEYMQEDDYLKDIYEQYEKE